MLEVKKWQLLLLLEQIKKMAEEETTEPVTLQYVIDKWKETELRENDIVFRTEDINLDVEEAAEVECCEEEVNLSNGLIFRLKANLSKEDINLLHQSLVHQYNQGVVIEPKATEFIGTYIFELNSILFLSLNKFSISLG